MEIKNDAFVRPFKRFVIVRLIALGVLMRFCNKPAAVLANVTPTAPGKKHHTWRSGFPASRRIAAARFGFPHHLIDATTGSVRTTPLAWKRLFETGGIETANLVEAPCVQRLNMCLTCCCFNTNHA